MSAARITIERILRDNDDDSGQSVRDWKIESDRSHITLRSGHGTTIPILILPADVDELIGDLQRAKEAALDLAKETP